MNIQCTRIALLLLLVFSASTASAQSEPQVINVPLSRPGEPVNLDISIISAYIEVIGEARDDAQFEVSVLDGSRKIITPSGTRNLSVGAYSVDIEERDNHISLDTDWRANSVRVLARIPSRADLELETVNNGEIRVANITGSLSLVNTNGPITATGISGSVIAESVNDDIEVSFDRLEGAGVMSMHSVNGDLILGLPSDAGAELHIDSAEGEIVSDFEVDVVPSEPIVTRETDRGGIEVKVESVIVARLGGGGTVFKLKTLNGDIEIRKSN
jgi:hypothetical protein